MRRACECRERACVCVNVGVFMGVGRGMSVVNECPEMCLIYFRMRMT